MNALKERNQSFRCSHGMVVLLDYTRVVEALVPPRRDQNKRTLAFRCQARGLQTRLETKTRDRFP